MSRHTLGPPSPFRRASRFLCLLLCPLLCLTGALFGLWACSTEETTPADSTEASGVPVGDVVESFSLTDQKGESLSDASLRGRVWVLGFFSSTCAPPCPTLMEAQLQVQNELFNHPDADSLRLVSLSTDPATDTVSALATFAEEQAYAYQDRWRFAAVGPDQTAALASSLGIEEGAASLVLVDREGRVRGAYDVAVFDSRGADAPHGVGLDRLLADVGDAESVERIEVEWPSRATQAVEGPIEVGRRHVLSEPSS